MFAEMIMIWLCLATSMIELFMLDLVMVMIYLFQNLIMQLPNFSTLGTCTEKEATFQRPGNIDAQPLVHTRQTFSTFGCPLALLYVALGLARTM